MAIFRCGQAVLASPSIFPMSTSERCFPFSRVGGMFSIVEQSRIEGGDAEIAGGIILILIDFTWQILYIEFDEDCLSIMTFDA